MIVYVLRHGEAENKAESPEKNDASRRLTLEGRAQVKNACELARKFGAKPSIIISSPLVRAKQTGEIARQVLNAEAEFKIDTCLEPESSPARIYETLAKLKKKDEVMLVTHLPILGDFIVDFVSRKDVSSNLETGSIMKIENVKGLPKTGSGTVYWLLPQMSSFRKVKN